MHILAGETSWYYPKASPGTIMPCTYKPGRFMGIFSVRRNHILSSYRGRSGRYVGTSKKAG